MVAAVFSHRLRRKRAAAWALALVSVLAAGPALAQTRGTWNVDADGLWSGSSNWLNNTIAGGNSGTATFANNITFTRTITLDTNRSLGSFIFGDADTATAASWIVTGSTMTMNNGTNSALLTVNALGTGATATLSTVLANSTSPSIIKNGVGTLVLSATNTFTGKLEIAQGTLQVGADRNLGLVGTAASDRITISNGATLRTSAAFTLNAARGITIGSGGGTISANGGLLTIAARLTGSGNTATVTGSSALTLTNASGTATDVNWDFASNSGLRTFFEGANALGTGSVQVRNGIRLTSQSVASGTLSNAVTLDSGAGLTARSSGGALTYTNVIFPSAGTVTFNKDDETTSILTITSGGALTGNLTFDTSQGGTNAVANVVLGGVFSGTGGLVKSGTGVSGRLVLRGANTYTGTTRINTGTLQLGNGGAVGSLATSSVITGSAGATLAFNRTDTISSGTHFNTVIGGAVNVTQLGSGTVIFAGANTYTGTTSINAGTLQLGDGGAVGSLATSSVITGSAGATLAFNRTDTISSGTHFNTVIGGAVNVAQLGSGTVLFAGANTYTGTTSVNAGTLQLGAGGSIANSAAIVLATGSTTFDVSLVAGGFSLGAAQVLLGEGTVVGSVTANGTIAPGIAGGAGTLSFANNLSLGSGSILNYLLSGTNLTVGGGVNDLSSITGDLLLSGTLNVTETVAGSFLSASAGDSWRLFNYSGSLTDSGFSLGSMPALTGGNTFQIDTSTANQVNLVVVPEPATIATVMVGLGMLGLVRARRRLQRVGH